MRVQEDTDVIRRLLRWGATGYWIPNAIVHHRIGRERQTIRYIAAYYEQWGETWASLNASVTATAPFLCGIPGRIWPRLLVWWTLYRFCRFIFPAPVWVQYLKAFYYNKGMLRFWFAKTDRNTRDGRTRAVCLIKNFCGRDPWDFVAYGAPAAWHRRVRGRDRPSRNARGTQHRQPPADC